MSTVEWSSEFDEVLKRNLPLHTGPVNPAARLADLGLDSLGTVSLVMELEDGMGISIPDELLVAETFETANTLWIAVKSLVATATA